MNTGADDDLARVLNGDFSHVTQFAGAHAPDVVIAALLPQLWLAYRASGASADAVALGKRLAPAISLARRRAGPAQRELDLRLLATMRREGFVTPVLGAGVSKAAGGPLWPELVGALLTKALERGFDRVQTKPNVGPSDLLFGTAERVVGRDRFSPAAEREARAIRARIEAKTADTDALMRGAELCLDLAGQRLFAEVTELLYARCPTPGPIHSALAELANAKGGWLSIATYNFDDLMGEALDRAGVARAALVTKGRAIAFAPNALAKPLGMHGDYTRVLHLHGFSPRRFFYVTHIKFVFATRQYAEFYASAEKHMLDTFVNNCLAPALSLAVYIGCSFEDAAMNELVRKTLAPFPGRFHYALLQWPGPGNYTDTTAEQIAAAEQRYVAFGVQPIWFDRFDELPALITALR